MSNDITAAGSLIQIISQSRQSALKKVNEELINMYWRVGERHHLEMLILIQLQKKYKMPFRVLRDLTDAACIG